MCAMPIFTLPYITPKYIKLYFPFASLCLLLIFVVRFCYCYFSSSSVCCVYSASSSLAATYVPILTIKRKKERKKERKNFVSIVV